MYVCHGYIDIVWIHMPDIRCDRYCCSMCRMYITDVADVTRLRLYIASQVTSLYCVISDEFVLRY